MSTNKKRLRVRKKTKAKDKSKADKKTRSATLSSAKLMKAIEGTGGIKKLIAENADCAMSTLYGILIRKVAKYDDLRLAIKLEQDCLGDSAEETIKITMTQRLDMGVASTTARWFLYRKFVDRGYGKKDQLTVEGGESPLLISHSMVNIIDLDLDLETKRKILEAVRKKRKADEKEEEAPKP